MTNDLFDYILAHTSAPPAEINSIERRTQLHLANPRMCSGHLQGRLLTMLASLKNPRYALELGTFSAYSSLCLAEGMNPGAKLHTIEANDELEDFISRSLADSPHGSKVEVHFGKALQIIPQIAPSEGYDLVFIDADKREYPAYYEAIKPRLAPGALIIADNTLWDGHVIDPEYTDAQTQGIRSFNDMVKADTQALTVMLPMRDGLTLIKMKT